MASERNKFIKEMIPYSCSMQVGKESEEQIAHLIKSVPINFPASILEIPCGYGTHAMTLAKKGFNVTACDHLDETLELAKNRSFEMSLLIDWVKNDVLNFQQNQKFHFVLNLGYSFGFFEDPNKDKEAILNFHKHLLPGGKLIMQLVGRDLLEKFFKPKYWVQLEEEVYLLNERKMDYETGWLEENYTLLKENDGKKFVFGTRIYYPNQISNLLVDCGFQNIKIYGDLDGRPYDQKAQCLLVIAEKLTIENQNFIKC